MHAGNFRTPGGPTGFENFRPRSIGGSGVYFAMTGLPPKADIRRTDRHVREMPISDICGIAEANAHAMLAYRFSERCFHSMDDMSRRGNWEKRDERIRDRRRNDDRDPLGGGIGSDRVWP